jgi:RHS repeat-associated protein
MGQTNASSFQYTGRENDGTGLSFDRARYYNPTLGRFISEDPIGFRGGRVNLYSYVENSPVDHSDPMGTSEFYVHGIETFDAAMIAGYGPLSALDLAFSAMWKDLGTQTTDPADTGIHGMGGLSGRKSDSPTPQTCSEAYQNTIKTLASELQNGDLRGAAHTVEDSYAPGHQYKTWYGGLPSWVRIKGEPWLERRCERGNCPSIS